MDCPAWTVIGVVRFCELKLPMTLKFVWLVRQAPGLVLPWQVSRVVLTTAILPVYVALAVPDRTIAYAFVPDVGLCMVRLENKLEPARVPPIEGVLGSTTQQLVAVLFAFLHTP